MKILFLKIESSSESAFRFNLTSLDPSSRIAHDWVTVNLNQNISAFKKSLSAPIAEALIAGDSARILRIGKNITKELVPPEIAKVLSASDAKTLILDVDSAAAGMPWDLALLEDGQIVGRKFLVSRNLRSPDLSPYSHKKIGNHFLIVGNPDGSLPEASQEANNLKTIFDPFGSVSLIVESVHQEELLSAIHSSDVFHYAGHSGMKGFQLGEGFFVSPSTIKSLPRTPYFVFLNSCDAAASEGWSAEHPNLVRAFLEAGSHVVIAPRAAIPSKHARLFAEEIYLNIIQRGFDVGQSLTRASKTFGDNHLLWESFVIYGNPLLNIRSAVSPTKKAFTIFESNNHTTIAAIFLASLTIAFLSLIKAIHRFSASSPHSKELVDRVELSTKSTSQNITGVIPDPGDPAINSLVNFEANLESDLVDAYKNLDSADESFPTRADQVFAILFNRPFDTQTFKVRAHLQLKLLGSKAILPDPWKEIVNVSFLFSGYELDSGAADVYPAMVTYLVEKYGRLAVSQNLGTEKIASIVLRYKSLQLAREIILNASESLAQGKFVRNSDLFMECNNADEWLKLYSKELRWISENSRDDDFIFRFLNAATTRFEKAMRSCSPQTQIESQRSAARWTCGTLRDAGNPVVMLKYLKKLKTIPFWSSQDAEPHDLYSCGVNQNEVRSYARKFNFERLRPRSLINR
jgi:hypothetical protein